MKKHEQDDDDEGCRESIGCIPKVNSKSYQRFLLLSLLASREYTILAYLYRQFFSRSTVLS
jgi:hypothetical protein